MLNWIELPNREWDGVSSLREVTNKDAAICKSLTCRTTRLAWHKYLFELMDYASDKDVGLSQISPLQCRLYHRQLETFVYSLWERQI